MHSKLWKITKMLLAVLVLLTVNIGCAPVQGEDKMTHVEWSAFYMSRNHQFRTLCYRFEVNYDSLYNVFRLIKVTYNPY